MLHIDPSTQVDVGKGNVIDIFSKVMYSSLLNISLGRNSSLGSIKVKNLGRNSSLGWEKEKTSGRIIA